ncbi:MAG TPA: hypothetical protein VN688_21225 [Gemmataceae bacterium]|nr:hypothetical protein [Gemmataceae bacterium]
MFAVDATITIPSWVERIALPEYPAMPIAGYVLLALGALLLMIGYFAPIKKLPALLTALVLLAYYPLVYLLSWYLFRYDEQGRLSREPTKFEVFLLEHKTAFEWSILGICAFFGLLFFIGTVWATVRKRRRNRVRETASENYPFTEQPVARPQPAFQPQPANPRPTAPRPSAPPQVPQARKISKKPPSPPSDNPFNFG